MKTIKTQANFKYFVKMELLKKRKSMKDLAGACDISQQLLNQYMAGTVKFETYKDLILSGLNKL